MKIIFCVKKNISWTKKILCIKNRIFNEKDRIYGKKCEKKEWVKKISSCENKLLKKDFCGKMFFFFAK